MIWLWLLEAATGVIGWVVSWFPDSTITYPAAPSVILPVPLGLNVGSIEAVFVLALIVAAVLIVGRLLTWIYRLIPTNG